MKHIHTADETAALNVRFLQSFADLKSVEAEFESVRASYKAKTSEAESRMETLSAILHAGFELRDKECVRVLDIQAGRKFFYEKAIADHLALASPDPADWPRDRATITETLTEADRQQELIEAEAKFEAREEIELFLPAEGAFGALIVGRLADKWYSALRVKIGPLEITERLDSEQSCTKRRPDAVKRACNRFSDWLKENLGRDQWQGFKNALTLVEAAHAEREE